MITLAFSAGTLEVRGIAPDASALPAVRWDPRAGCHRAPAIAYADVVRALVRGGLPYEDKARAYAEIPGARALRAPRPYQTEALAAWRAARGRGVVVLPTGAGKTHLATMAIDDKKRATLVVAPTLDLVRQWYDLLRDAFPVPIGVVGGGEHAVEAITVTTYDSAYLHMEHVGARFGLIVFDEVHHLPGQTYALAARFCLAPFRLGLTATPERADGREAELAELVGQTVYRRDIVDLEGDYLAEYETERLDVALEPEAREEYERERAIYRGFLGRAGIQMSRPDGWQQFIIRSSRSAEGRRAMAAYRRQREIAFCAPGKIELVEEILARHSAEQAIVFTSDNATAYAIARRLLLPIITHQTRVKERSDVLARLGTGEYGAVVTSRVLNEGVDVPSVSVAIVVSGSGSVREHVQRLGRILRKKDGKRAVLYELVTAGTGEAHTSERRRQHVAYK